MVRKTHNIEKSHPEPSLTHLVRRAQNGDRASYDRIVSRFLHMALAYGCSVTGDRHVAEDAAQEAFVEAFLHLTKLAEPAAFPGWLRTIVYRQCHRILRRRHVETIPLYAACDLVLETMTPAQMYEIGEVREQLATAIDSLAEPERLAVTLYYLSEQTVSEVAAFLSLPTNTIKKRLQSARKKLRERLVYFMAESVGADKTAKDKRTRDEAFAGRVREMLDAAQAGHVETVKSLLQMDPAYARVMSESDFATPLHMVVESNNVEIAQALIAAGADLNAKYNKTGHTPLSWAVTYGSFDVAEALLRGGALLDLWCAAGLGKLDAVKSFWDAEGRLADQPSMTGSSRYDSQGNPLPRPPETQDEMLSDALYIASRNARIQVMQWLLDHGASPRFRAYIGGSPLHWAYFSAEPQAVELLLAHGADPDALDDEIQGPPHVFGIMEACGFGIVRLARRILDTGLGNVNCTSPRGTPLHWAARWGNVAIIELLLERSADPNALSPEGKTPLDIARERGHEGIITLLEQTSR